MIYVPYYFKKVKLKLIYLNTTVCASKSVMIPSYNFVVDVHCLFIIVGVHVLIQVSTIQLLFDGPTTGIPSSASLSLDLSIMDEIMQVWKSQITAIAKSLKTVQKRKHLRDKSLLLGLLICSIEGAIKSKVSC